MAEEKDKIAVLSAKLELLLKRQQDFTLEVNELRKDLQILRNTQAIKLTADTNTPSKSENIAPTQTNNIEKTQPLASEKPIAQPRQSLREKQKTSVAKKVRKNANIEKFIGENLINKIGIIITIIGIGIGAKYSIENNLISPLTRIIIGYCAGLLLVGVGFKLKANYKNYSAVLVGGALAIIYFITYVGYDLYDLIPQTIAFAIMVPSTVFGVVASVHYNQQVIAHIGLVGAYGIPFLLSDGSGNTLILFSYIALINMGVLVISLKKYWKSLHYAAFTFTWLIFSGWYISTYPTKEYTLAFGFLFFSFLQFHFTALAYKLLKLEKYTVGDVLLLFLNSFLLYGFGIGLLTKNEQLENYTGLFTLLNALIHFGVTFLIFKRKLADKKPFYLSAILVLTFITIAIPVQLNGNWVTLLWALEATLLFWVGRTKKVSFYENISYVLTFFTLLSLCHDWEYSYNTYNMLADKNTLQPFINSTLTTSIICVAALGCMHWLQLNHKPLKSTVISKIMSVGIPGFVLIVLYFTFYLEIDYYWNYMFETTKLTIPQKGGSNYFQYNYAHKEFASVWLLMYTLLFLSVLNLINTFKIKNKLLAISAFCISLLVLFVFLSVGLYALSELRNSYLDQKLTAYFVIGAYAIYIRYLAFALFAILLWSLRKLITQGFFKIDFKIPFEIVLHLCILWCLSSELLHWMDFFASTQSYKLGLSILWGVYALMLIIFGIWRNKKHLRITAISLFSITLIKLFLYDIASYNTIAKTIVFVSLGLLLLIISFLYNKYTHKIADEN